MDLKDIARFWIYTQEKRWLPRDRPAVHHGKAGPIHCDTDVHLQLRVSDQTKRLLCEDIRNAGFWVYDRSVHQGVGDQLLFSLGSSFGATDAMRLKAEERLQRESRLGEPMNG